MKMLKKLAACSLSACMVLSFAPMAYAEPTEEEIPSAQSTAGHRTGLIEDYTPARSIYDENYSAPFARAGLPASYSSVEQGYVTPVVDQGESGACWAFGTIAAAEASIKKEGLSKSPDLSERHLTYFTYHKVADPIGGTKGDATVAKSFGFDERFDGASDLYLASGGNQWMTLYTLASWMGAAPESVAPWSVLNSKYEIMGAEYEMCYNGSTFDKNKALSIVNKFLGETALPANKAYSADFHLENAYSIAMADASEVKKAIMDYGGAAIAYCSDSSYFNSTNNAHYNFGEASTDHIVTVVGWDDNFSSAKFGWESSWPGFDASVTKPKDNGAWLCKNSWGPNWGDNGYFWLSYEDAALNQDWSKAFVYDMASANNFANNYQYDGTSGTCYNHLDSGGSISNVFTAAGRGNQGETLEAVSFALDDVNVDYSVQIFLNPKNASEPTSGIPALTTPATGKTLHGGYYTVKLPQKINLKAGTKFAVVVTLSHSNGAEVNYSIETTYGAGDRYEQYVHHTNAWVKGQSFVKEPGEGWRDLSGTAYRDGNEPDATARIKAFTNNVGGAAPTTTTTPTKPTTQAATQKQQMYRLYNPNSGEHFYTANAGEKDHLVTVGWQYEGIGWNAPAKSKSPVYRLYNANAGDHHYTMSAGERDSLVAVGWSYEGVGWYSDDAKGVALYRQYNPNALAGSHNYTTSKAEHNQLVSIGWQGEGVGWYGCK